MFRILSALIILSASSAQAVVVAGSNGEGSVKNTTVAELDAVVANPFPYYDNVVQYMNSTGVYLGYDSVSKDVYLLTAKHVTGTSNVTIDGVSYVHQERTNLSSDMAILRYKDAGGAVPSLPAMIMTTTPPSAGSPIVMIGRGQARTEPGATTPLVSDATSTGAGSTGYHYTGTRIIRWGTNETVLSPAIAGLGWTGGNTTETVASFGEYFISNFDEPNPGEWMSTNEAAISTGDSGGGTFTYEGGEWKLAGVNSLRFPFDGQDANSAAFGNINGHLDVSTYLADINAVTGELTPEPSTSLLLALGGLAIVRRKR